MMPKNSGIHKLEGRVRREEPEYVELDELDLIYERTGTLCFPSRLMEINGRAAAAAGAGRDMTRAPSVRPASRHAGPIRGREVRSLAPMGVPQRTTQPSLRAKQRARRVYPSFGQRALAEVRRLRFAKRSVVLAGVAAVAAAGAFVASSALVPSRRAPREAAPTHPSPAAVVAERRAAERAPVPAPAHVGPRVSVLADEYEAAFDRPALDRPALDAPLTDAHSNGAEATASAKPRAPERSRPHEPCDCLPGDPLCGCLD